MLNLTTSVTNRSDFHFEQFHVQEIIRALKPFDGRIRKNITASAKNCHSWLQKLNYFFSEIPRRDILSVYILREMKISLIPQNTLSSSRFSSRICWFQLLCQLQDMVPNWLVISPISVIVSKWTNLFSATLLYTYYFHPTWPEEQVLDSSLTCQKHSNFYWLNSLQPCEKTLND